MDNIGIEIESVEFPGEDIVVKYANGAVETLPNVCETYERIHQKWLIDCPPFISDKFKAEMRNIILCSIREDPECECGCKELFSSPNEEKAKKFLTYLRTRESLIAAEKLKWTVLPPK